MRTAPLPQEPETRSRYSHGCHGPLCLSRAAVPPNPYTPTLPRPQEEKRDLPSRPPASRHPTPAPPREESFLQPSHHVDVQLPDAQEQGDPALHAGAADAHDHGGAQRAQPGRATSRPRDTHTPPPSSPPRARSTYLRRPFEPLNPPTFHSPVTHTPLSPSALLLGADESGVRAVPRHSHGCDKGRL